MRNPYELPKQDVADLLAEIQRQLYLEQTPDNGFVWNADKMLECDKFLEWLDWAFSRYNMHPRGGVVGPQKWVHRPQTRKAR